MSAGRPGYTFTPDTIATNPLDEVRAWLRDTGQDGEWVFSDAHINGFLTLMGTPCRVAAFLARQRAAEVAGTEGTSEHIGDLSVTVEGSAQHWNDLAREIESLCSALSGGMDAVSLGGRGSLADLPHLFQVGQHDSAGSGAAWYPGDPKAALLDDWLAALMLEGMHRLTPADYASIIEQQANGMRSLVEGLRLHDRIVARRLGTCVERMDTIATVLRGGSRVNPRLKKYLKQKVVFRPAGTQDQHGDTPFGTPTAPVRCRISNPTVAHRRLVAQLESIDPSMVVYFDPDDWPAYGPKVGDHLQVPDANWQPVVRIDRFYAASGAVDHYRVIVGS